MMARFILITKGQKIATLSPTIGLSQKYNEYTYVK